ncbi:cyclopropane fatty acyl phospholipid synthase [Burkholderia cenocepacia]|jgi:cyclopropane-fatty-acyl-phospholipid synthase|uniref:cyclopropane fatty acyl phospholipid synthase n=1 Tax=Burkholderia cenocepacia TaxID=95486 RepID=UPI001F3FBF79|nr:cyclopropane fatty acyl phospholipid synthase [Burkholderia cenocepacia]MCG0577998.1 cyclopropane fatty acyl phospholipid synthase [Burkholderia cenocepacia]MCW3524456.1 cyclopropane fatty acyl phospholipid synthase [Burkholderia cenocepacia]MCW3614678.1 cyclopropane fatty acyl phospholipid synthase [Burkholderia cenocepacia]MCW3652616.1 cyclopropane fatty acyl phospholipid synthase [Burkholderia cenocepacia]MCW3667588.1 cyclopropane fatty acyl phospholipid synthase [Burkholderia cenocepaci
MQREHLPKPVGQAQHSAPSILVRLLAAADIEINGGRPWDIQVFDREVYGRILSSWSLGLGEAYMDGLWDCDQLDELFTRLLEMDIDEAASGLAKVHVIAQHLRHKLFNLQSARRAFQVGEQHYDAGNDVFSTMLDSRMIYSCGYWGNAADLEEAQVDKLKMICDKLQLQPGETLLDIGCGWGGLAHFAAEHYGVKVTGVTVSKEQLTLARERCKGFPVNFVLQDYRELEGRFDKIVSVGMFEHVGPKNYDTYFGTVHRLLEPQGIFLLHSIGLAKTSAGTDPWIDRYIFPNGKLPSAYQLSAAVEPWFVIEDWHNFGRDYDRTLMAWWQRFEQAWPTLKDRYDRRFYLMWKYYLHCCAGFFRSRQGQLWQVILTHTKRRDTYRSMRPLQTQRYDREATGLSQNQPHLFQ